MNNRSLSRGDAVVIGAAVVLFIASFLDFYSAGFQSWNGWSNFWWPVMPSVFLAGFFAAGLIAGSRFLSPEFKLLGLKLDQWGVALSVFAFWTALWTLFGSASAAKEGLDIGAGQIIAFIALIVLLAGAVLPQFVPVLRAPLIPAGGPKAGQQPYGQQPGYGYPQGGQPSYGYPNGPQPGAPHEAQAPYDAQAPYGGQQPQQPYAEQQPYAGQQPQQAHAAAAPQAAQAPQPAAAQPQADPNFQPFWFAVPAARPLVGEDGSPQPVAELTPGVWYLAVEQRGQALIAQTQDGRRGLLQDTSGIQRG
ncbi:hypothetical protein JJV70_15455 [Streptomyces sp. JJ66]|uniref:DUF5336 domain-containing protein n=1 Tax=Streptomyces sp. JJ66 TaxID=2803843 RepID=UPI001C57B108|nr:DUF5336 domain-containing protein [Streptomyces sp. JJ66]MBW1603475.1 hypothetical protein [Streptomyces sp. JJ66]